MNKSILFVLILSLPVFVYSQDKKAVKHKLKSITEYEQRFEKGVAGKNLVEQEIRYDERGNITEEIEYKLGKVDKHFKYEYDDSNNKVKETELDPSGRKFRTTEYKYKDGLRTEKTVFDAANKMISKKTYKYETY